MSFIIYYSQSNHLLDLSFSVNIDYVYKKDGAWILNSDLA